jgi:hypothetical protein
MEMTLIICTIINSTWFFIRLNILYLLLIIYNKIIDSLYFFS